MKKIIIIALVMVFMACKKQESQLPFTSYQEMVSQWGKADYHRCIENCSFNDSTVEYDYKNHSATVTVKGDNVLKIYYWR